jgi:uncharacterized protein
MARAEPGKFMTVTVAYSPGPGVVDEEDLVLNPGSTLRDALAACRLLGRHPGVDIATARVGVWGKLRPLDDPLRDHDRVEIYRPLLVDPKEARRLRYRKHLERFKP